MSTTTLNVSGAFTASTLTDGTATLTGGDLTGVGTVSAATVSTTTLNVSGAFTAATLTDGTATLTGGDLTGVGDVIASGDVGSATAHFSGEEIAIVSNSGENSLTVDDTTVQLQATDGATSGQVNVAVDEASVLVDNGTAVHGLVVGTTNTVLSGGTTSTTLTLDDSGAHLDNDLDMGGNRVTNMADGVAPGDAATMRQFNNLEEEAFSGIANVAALAAIPAPQAGHNFSVGVGGGNYKGNSAIAAGFNANVSQSWRVTGGVGVSHGNVTSSVGVGFSW